MDNFVLLQKADVSALRKELDSNVDLFGSVPIRTSYEGSAHKQVQDILLRGPELSPTRTLAELQADLQCYDYNTFSSFPEAYRAVHDFMGLLKGQQLGRVLVTKLPKGCSIDSHIDEGPAADFYIRYHIVLQGEAGSTFTSGDETVEMLTGEVWYINNQIPHSVYNGSDTDRIHLIVDIKDSEYFALNTHT